MVVPDINIQFEDRQFREIISMVTIIKRIIIIALISSTILKPPKVS